MRRYQKALKLPISLSLKFRFKMQLTSDLNRKQKNDRLDNITFFSQNGDKGVMSNQTGSGPDRRDPGSCSIRICDKLSPDAKP